MPSAQRIYPLVTDSAPRVSDLRDGPEVPQDLRVLPVWAGEGQLSRNQLILPPGDYGLGLGWAALPSSSLDSRQSRLPQQEVSAGQDEVFRK